jgi:hypothetical protein
MKKKNQSNEKAGLTAVAAELLEMVRGGSGLRASDGTATRSGDDDDPNGGIVIIGRDGP